MAKTIRWGIAGAGNIANKFAKAVKNVECAQIVAVTEIMSEEKGRAFAKEYDIENVFTSYEEMAASDLIDAVYVATIHPFHKPCAEIFLKAGKHVLCEKPLCVNAAQAEELKKCAGENNVFLMEGIWTKFAPAVIELKKLLQSGKIGEVKSVTADFCYNALHDISNETIFGNRLAGGALLDVGVYGLHFASYLFDEAPETILACADMHNDVDYHTSVLLKYANGAIANISSAVALSKPDTAYIYGTKGFVRVPMFYGAKEFYVNTDGNEERYSFPPIGDGFEEEIIEVCTCINDGKLQSEIHPLTSSLEILNQMDFIRKQIELKYPFDV